MEFTAINGTSAAFVNCSKDFGLSLVTEFLALFYIVSPSEAIKESILHAPNLIIKSTPVFIILIATEAFIRYQRNVLIRFSDIFMSIASIAIIIMFRLFYSMIAMNELNWIYNNYAIVELPLYSIWTWLLALIIVDFEYYWVHRAAHEFNFFWSSHRYHHMTEDMCITAAVRFSFVDIWSVMLSHLLLAFIIPPPVLVVHVQLIYIYQLWVHTTVIGDLGYLEYIINTPSLHNVHHGKNPYCIDKNYGSFLMIWDHIFGTYQKKTEKIVFGILSPVPKTFNIITLQFSGFVAMWQKFQKCQGFGNKLSAIFKGPGWSPGKPRLGRIGDTPEPDHNKPKFNYDPFIPNWKRIYTTFHLAIFFVILYMLIDQPYLKYSPIRGFFLFIHVVIVSVSFGAILDNRTNASILEILRCFSYFAVDVFLITYVNWNMGVTINMFIYIFLWLNRLCNMFSILFWLYYHAMKQWTSRGYSSVPDDDKDVKSETLPAFKTNPLKSFCLLTIIGYSIIMFVILVKILKLDSCHDMLDMFFR